MGPETNEEPEIIDSVSATLPVDQGEVGLVLDTREIFRKGYVPETAEITFSQYSRFDATVNVDPVTSLAVLAIENEQLTDAEKEAFAQGVATRIRIIDDTQTVLSDRQEAALVLDASNTPLPLQTTRAAVPPPLELRDGIPYLLQPEIEEGVITTRNGTNYPVEAFRPGASTQHFYFRPVPGAGDPHTYTIQHRTTATPATYWSLTPLAGRIELSGDDQNPPTHPHQFVVEQDEDGWVRLRLAGSNEYLMFFGQCTSAPSFSVPCELRPSSSTQADRFRIISDDLDWSLVDQGTVFNDPVIPPAKLDFAYAATIRNCSPATLTETVGRSESRTQSSTTETSESLELFSSAQVSVGYKVGVRVGRGTPRTGQVEGSVESSTSLTVTTGSTRSTRNTTSETIEKTTEVSRIRELEVPPFSGIEVYDAIRTIENVRIPFTQVFRIRASSKTDGAALSGDEIRTQFVFNFVEGIPSNVGADFVDLSIRGDVLVDQMFETETNANELPGVCD